jgi:hypothetical protein
MQKPAHPLLKLPNINGQNVETMLLQFFEQFDNNRMKCS